MIDDLPGRQVSRCRRRDNRLAARGAGIRSLYRRAPFLVAGYSGGPATFELSVKMQRIVVRRHRVAPAGRREHSAALSHRRRVS
jgi:hypothetical protein